MLSGEAANTSISVFWFDPTLARIQDLVSLDGSPVIALLLPWKRTGSMINILPGNIMACKR